MSRLIDETGKRYTRLTVIKQAGYDKTGNATWLYKCDCGVRKIARGYDLRKGHVRSCGCYHHDKVSKPHGVAAFNALYHHIKKGAKARKIEFSLTKEQVHDIVARPCCYCDSLPLQVKRPHRGNGVFIYNGIDRIDNSKGYIMGNVVPCCKWCNYAKRERSESDFLKWAEKVCEKTRERGI